MIPIFYAPPENIDDDSILLCGEESHHLRRVMRLGKSEAVIIIDGAGTAYKAEVDRFERESVYCRWFSRIRGFGEPHYHLTLAAGLSTRLKFDELIERGTEMGVSRFIPLISAKSRVNIEVSETAAKKLERWRKVAIASVKQCERALIPEIMPPTNFAALFEKSMNRGVTLIFAPSEEALSIDAVNFEEERKRHYNFTVVTGPESGFAPDELELAQENGAVLVTLGKRILRTENAGPTAAALVMFMLGEFK